MVFINGDDETLTKLNCEMEIRSYGLSSGCSVRAENISFESVRETTFDIVCGNRRIPVTINAYGIHLVSAGLGAAAVGIFMGLSDEEIAKGISEYAPVASRSAAIDTGKIIIIDDCYNANPSSVKAAIDSLVRISGRRVCILGDMCELGETEKRLHFIVGEYAAKCGVDRLIACGRLSENTVEGAKTAGCLSTSYFNSKAELQKELPSLIEKGDAVLVKASHSQAFEEIVGWLKDL